MIGVELGVILYGKAAKKCQISSRQAVEVKSEFT
jgi:hypothetical protein